VKLGKTLLVLAGATVLLGALVATASAGRLSTSSQELRATFAPLEFSGGFGTTRCPLTLEGSFHQRTTSKAAGSLVGYLTRATAGACSQGSVTVLTETLPWHIRYASFSGTLPNITSVTANIVGSAFRVREPGGVTCLARSTEAEPTSVTFNREASGALTTAVVSGAIRVGAECFGATGTIAGTSNSLTVASATTRITVTLI
jgi:hypothetical protein